MREINKKDQATTLVYAFIMPIILILPAFASVGIYPFGDQSLLIVDMYNEYVDYLAQMNETVRSSGSLLRSWNMGMGLNMLGLIAFYTSSPFNLIVLLLPISVITESIFAVTLIKLGAAGLFFAIFARNVFPDASNSFHVIFSVAYALMGYNIAYSSNVMWLDGAAFLPLVLLGVEKILREGRYRFFILSLIYVFFTSYYIGYMIGIFSFLYFTASYFAKSEPPWQNSMRAYARILPRFLGSAALATGCCAFLLLPAFLNLKAGQDGMWPQFLSFEMKYPAIQLASKLLPGAYDSLTDSGLPNVYCTVLAVMLCVLYFCAKAVPRREKFIFGGLLAFIIFSFSCELLDLAWHAFEVPTWFPARYSFVFSFFVLFLALRCACVLTSVSQRAILASVVTVTLIFIEVAVNRFAFVHTKSVIAGLALALLYATALMLWKNGNRRALSAFLILLVCMESFGNAAFTVIGIDNQFEYRSRSGYKDFIQAYGGAVSLMKATDSGVYRSEILDARNANGAMALGYNGISHYSSTTDQRLNKFLRDLGYNKGTENELRFSVSTPVTNGLLGIKYVLSKDEINGAYSLRDKSGDIGIYENSAAFPLAFWAPSAVLDFEVTGKSPFQIQNELISALTGEACNIFLPLQVSPPKLDNVEKTTNDGYIGYERQIRNRQSTVVFTAINPDENEAFAFFPVYDNNFSPSEVFVNSISQGRDFTYRANTIIPLGSGQRPELTIIPAGAGIAVEAEYFAALDLEAAKKAAGTAAQNQMHFTKFSDTAVDGNITAPKDGLLATTFPFDPGWTIKVDGRRVKQLELAGVFLAVPLAAGEHEITMQYLPPGFVAGCTITVMSICGMIAFYMLRKRRRA